MGELDLLAALGSILDAETEFRASLPADWEGDPLHDACLAARAAIARTEGELDDAEHNPPTPLTYRDFVRGPGGEMIRRLGLGWTLGRAHGWRTLQRLVVDWNDSAGARGKPGRFVEAVRRGDGVFSSGERVLLHAFAAAMDFAWLADELAGGEVWQRMPSVGGAHQRALLACILQEDR